MKPVLAFAVSRQIGSNVIEINDFGATPGMVMLRLQQAAEEGRS